MMSKAKKEPTRVVPKLFFRRHEAAYALGVSVRFVDGLIADQTLTTRKARRCVLIPGADIERVAQMIMADKLVSRKSA